MPSDGRQRTLCISSSLLRFLVQKILRQSPGRRFRIPWVRQPSRVSHTSHTSHSNDMSHTSHITATTEQIQALSLLRDESTTSILAYTKHARSLAHGIKQGAGHELLTNEQLDAIDTLSSCREDEVRTLLGLPHASRKSSIHVTALHSQPNRVE